MNSEAVTVAGAEPGPGSWAVDPGAARIEATQSSHRIARTVPSPEDDDRLEFNRIGPDRQCPDDVRERPGRDLARHVQWAHPDELNLGGSTMRGLASVIAAAGVLALGTGQTTAETLPLPEDLIALQSDAGEELLFSAEARADYTLLSLHFVTQQNPAFCGPATIAMVLNALEIPRPPSDLTLGLGMFDQDNIFNRRVEATKPRAEVMRNGMTLDELGAVLAAYDLDVAVLHAEDSSLDAFREAAVAELGERGGFVLVNYLRSAVGQERGGHISPLAAYDADTDRFLVLDVSRYKYPPIWVEAAALFDAMRTPDPDNNDRTRGFVIVGR
jgi:hypothetical protein